MGANDTPLILKVHCRRSYECFPQGSLGPIISQDDLRAVALSTWRIDVGGVLGCAGCIADSMKSELPLAVWKVNTPKSGNYVCYDNTVRHIISG